MHLLDMCTGAMSCVLRAGGDFSRLKRAAMIRAGWSSMMFECGRPGLQKDAGTDSKGKAA